MSRSLFLKHAQLAEFVVFMKETEVVVHETTGIGKMIVSSESFTVTVPETGPNPPGTK